MGYGGVGNKLEGFRKLYCRVGFYPQSNSTSLEGFENGSPDHGNCG